VGAWYPVPGAAIWTTFSFQFEPAAGGLTVGSMSALPWKVVPATTSTFGRSPSQTGYAG
jgi:hypothetical protein